ncbi:hypothetical protein ABZP36_002915 [Zizania latifolia]
MAAVAAGLVLLLAFASSSAVAFKFNVTEILDEFPEFSVFNGLLSQTMLADEINRRLAVTVLVVDDSAVGAITSLPVDTQRKVLAVQVLLDYYDPVKLDGVKGKTALLATLFQATGAATGRVGFVNYTQGADDQMAFGSAEPGAPLSSLIVKVVASRPYNLSVMQISAAIVPPSIGLPSTPAISDGSKSPSQTPAKTTDTPEVTTTAYEFDTPAGTSADYDDDVSPATSTPSPASEGQAKANVSSTSPANQTSATAHTAADRTTTSAGSRVVVGARVGFMGLVMFIPFKC